MTLAQKLEVPVAVPFNIYTDGACKGNPGPGGWGVHAVAADGSVLFEAFGGDKSTTNNKMELQGVLEALSRIPAGSTLTIHTDSQYVMKGWNEWLPGWKRKGWRKADGKPVANVELWKLFEPLMAKHKAAIAWVRGHNGDPGNERADVLSNMGVDSIL